MSKYKLAGAFTFDSGALQVSLSDDQALQKLKGSARDPEEAQASLRDNPFGAFEVEGGKLFFTPHVERPVAVMEGGVSIPASLPSREQAEALVEVLRRVSPATYPSSRQLLDGEVTRDDQFDDFAATLMEQLDNLAPAELTFTARSRPGEEQLTLGFWPTEE